MGLIDEDKNWITEQLNKVSGQLNELSPQLNELSARIEKTETTLLTEFHKWASPMEARQRTHSAAIKAIDAEMEYLSDRVQKLEAR